MKKTLAILFVLFASVAAAHQARGEELAMFGNLPDPGKEWSVLKKGARTDRSFYSFSWVVFTNSRTGDILSFVADRYAGAVRTVSSDPVRQAAVDMFPGGYPHLIESNGPTGWVIEDYLRNGVMQLDATDVGAKKRVFQDALEYTYVYEDESQAARAARPHRLAHGYVLAFGDLVVFMQHTSDHAITTELANDMALSLVLIGAAREHAGNPGPKTQPSKGE